MELEKQFNTTLFFRNNRSVSLTPAGEILQVDFRITYQEQRELRELLIAGEIDIGLTFGFSIKYSPELSATKIAGGAFVWLSRKIILWLQRRRSHQI